MQASDVIFLGGLPIYGVNALSIKKNSGSCGHDGGR
jgi:hypothetical protein